MVQKESTIRDNLAKSLDVIESGLSLIQKKYPLPNPFGSKGYIDILARDSFGNRVIIELKRTDHRVLFLLGRLEWDGHTTVDSVNAMYSPEIGGLAEFFFMNSINAAWEHDDQLLRRHGLSYGTVKGEAFHDCVSNTPIRFIESNGSISAEKVEMGKDLTEFCAANEAYLRELVEAVPQISAGL